MQTQSRTLAARTAILVSADASLRQRLSATLTGMRWHVREAAGGAEALTCLEETPCEALLLDSWLPDLEAKELAAYLRQLYPALDLIRIDESEPSTATTVRSSRRNELLFALHRAQEGTDSQWEPRLQTRTESRPLLHRVAARGIRSPQAHGLHPAGSFLVDKNLATNPTANVATNPTANMVGDSLANASSDTLFATKSAAAPTNSLPAPSETLQLEMELTGTVESTSPAPTSSATPAPTSATVPFAPAAIQPAPLAAISVLPVHARPAAIPAIAVRPVATCLPEMVGASAAMDTLAQHIRLVAPRKTTVLIEGPTGSGKELVARALHRLSSRSDRPFVVLNCAAIPDALLEAELFGHTRGAFTGATQSRVGHVEAAHGGTLFLDEIGEMPLALQAKLLRFLEAGEVQRIGENEPIKVDVRVIAATHQPLAKRSEEGTFRSDLFYRLSVFTLHTAPLSQHPEDIPILATHFLERLAQQEPVKQFEAEAIAMMCQHHWPGNVRELAHVVERAYILAENRPRITIAEICFA